MNKEIKRRIFFSKRIQPDVPPEEVLPVHSGMSLADVTALYVNKTIEGEHYIHNGPWTLRGVVDDEGTLATNSMPPCVNAHSVWLMVKEKIDGSDALVATVNPKAYGTVLEIGYAVGLNRLAVYALADSRNTPEETVDLWMSFQLAYQTRHLWEASDIKNVKEFGKRGILSVRDYGNYVNNLVPRFLTRD